MNTTTLLEKKRLYKKSKQAYYNAKPIMSDAEFDLLEDAIRKQAPEWAALHRTGVRVGKKVEVELAHFMPSLHKVYPEDLQKWQDKNPAPRYTVMEKLDGSSVQLTYTAGKPVRLVTRGDGVNGKDISFLIPYLGLPSAHKHHKGTAVFRCEAVMRKSVFAKKWASKFDNSRNLVNGLLNRTDAHPALADVDLVVLGMYGETIAQGLSYAHTIGLMTVAYRLLKGSQIGPDVLSGMRAESAYDMDGLVVAPHSFELSYESADKPKGIVAFKVNDAENAAQVTVQRIIWQVTGRKRLVPKIEIEPTQMGGVTVTYATSHNAAWMLERKIGPGAIVRVLRSGGVIPKIVEVVRPGKFQPPSIPYTQEGVHFVVADADHTTARRIEVLNVVKFMKHLGVELIAGKTAAALYDAGLQCPADYVRAFGRSRLSGVIAKAGFDGRQGEKIAEEVQRVFSTPIKKKTLMVASQIFGVGLGLRKLAAVEEAGISMDQLDTLYEKPVRTKVAAKGFTQTTDSSAMYCALLSVPGFSSKTAQVVEAGWADWRAFQAIASQYLTLDGGLPKKATQAKAGKLSGQHVSFTGFRDKDVEAAVLSAGGEVVPFGSKTTLLVYKAEGRASTKVTRAKEKNIRVVELAKFKISL